MQFRQLISTWKIIFYQTELKTEWKQDRNGMETERKRDRN